MHSWRSMFPAFQTLGGISSRSAAFLFLIFSQYCIKSPSVNSPCLTSSWPLMIFWIGLSVISGGFLSRFLKCSFHFRNLSSWKATFILLLMCSSLCSVHLLSAVLFVIVYLQLTYKFYRFDFECILIALSGFSSVSAFWPLLGFT